MLIIYVLYIVALVLFIVVGAVCMKIKSSGMNVKDFLVFIFAINDLNDLYIYSKNNDNMSESEQAMFLKQAEELFNKFEKVPSIIWEDEYEKYEHVLETYKSIRMMKWAEMTV